ncbi:MAG TPA: glutamate 5-kinase, partial [Solirubrobacteraceae bacterium]|nr:glutamate 5-kinase [Solirubrobacteraceae bacterium]
MSTVVIKLGSSVVATDDGTVRTEVLERICDDVAALHAEGAEPILVTSGAIARGLGAMGIPPARRPQAIEELQAASAVGQGKLFRVYDDLLSARSVRSAQVLLTFFDMSARTHYLN